MNTNQKALELHSKHRGKIEIASKVPLESLDDLSLSYTPGVAEPCRRIAEEPEMVYEYTSRGNMVAVVTDGSAVLGLGNIGPEAALPVMEGKAILFKKFAGVDAFPICLNTQDPDEIVETVKRLEPSFGGINLEDISSPRCFDIERRLQREMKIPVFHDDQHGTAIVLLAGLKNALKLTQRKLEDLRVVICGAGAAGTAIAELLHLAGVQRMLLCDRHGIVGPGRDDIDDHKTALLKFTNLDGQSGSLRDALKGADVFIGVSAPNLLTADDIKTMADKPLVFALSNPTPEIMPDDAKAGGAYIVATGRSDFPNQLNNALVFPGIFKGALKARAQITDDMKLAAAQALADLVKEPTVDKIIPGLFDPGVADAVAAAVVTLAKT
ncbi:MAG: NADP-dependent malic enzyme [bacterium]|nr:NADP-dependent malic enzyme [bacterium]